MDHPPSPGTAGKVTADRQPAGEPCLPPDARSAPEPAAVTWARARLREQIQQAGAAPAPAAQPTNRQTRKTRRAPLADREPEP
jgi:hypothetical protein